MSQNAAPSSTVAAALNGVELYAGLRLPWLLPGMFDPSFLKAGYANMVVAICNALLNAQIQRAPAPMNQDGSADPSAGAGFLKWSKENLIIVLYDPAVSGSGTGGWNWRGDYDNTVAYAANDVARVQPPSVTSTTHTPAGPTIPGVYLNILGCTGVAPKHPLQTGGENANWVLIATFPSAIASCDQSGNTTTEFADSQPAHT